MPLHRLIGRTSAGRLAPLAAILAVVGVARSSVAQQPVVALSVRRDVSALLDSAVVVGRRGDTARFRGLVTPDFRFLHSTGRIDTIPDVLAFLTSIQPDTTRELSPATYVAVGDGVLVFKHEATRVPGRGWAEFRSSDLVVRAAPAKGGSRAKPTWRWAMHQSTGLPVFPSEWLPVPDTLLSAYAGEYVNAAGFVRAVRRDGDHLTITAVGGSELAYRALTPASFHAERGDAYAVFGRDERGQIAFLEILRPSGAERFARRPAK